MTNEIPKNTFFGTFFWVKTFLEGGGASRLIGCLKTEKDLAGGKARLTIVKLFFLSNEG